MLFNLFLEVPQISKDRTIIIQIGKKLLRFRNLQEKLEKYCYSCHNRPIIDEFVAVSSMEKTPSQKVNSA